MITVICLIVLAVVQGLVVRRLLTRRPVDLNSELFQKYEQSRDNLIELYQNCNIKLQEEKQALIEENKALMEAIDSENAEDIDVDDDPEEVVFATGAPEPCIELPTVISVSSSRLFKKIEAARALIHKTKGHLPADVSARLVDILTPESEAEAA